MKLSITARKKLEKKQLIKITLPNEIEVSHSTLFGLEKPKETLNDIIGYFNVKNNMLEPHKSYSIIGPLGSGKASLVYATAKNSGVPVISVDVSSFNVMTKSRSVSKKIELIFKTAEELKKDFPGCFIMFRNIHEISEYGNDGQFFLDLVTNFKDTSNIFVFGLGTNEEYDVPALVPQNNLFTTKIILDYPDLVTREKIIEHYIKKYNIKISENVSIKRLAKETIGKTPHDIIYIIKESQLFSVRQNHEVVMQDDFSETIVKISAGEKDKKMTDEERKLTAYHEAGHVIAGLFSNPKYVLSRVEISPRSLGSLGLTITDIDENKYSYFKKDFEQVIIECYGGLCAEEFIFGEHTSGVSADLNMAADYATKIVTKFGMDENFGPFIIASGKLDSQENKARADKCAKDILKIMFVKTKAIIKEHEAYLHAVANALIEKEVLLGPELEEIIKNVKSNLEK